MVNSMATPVTSGKVKKREIRFEGERREVTVAFADIRGFTTLAECIQPEELITVLNAYLSAVVEVFARYKGVINKFGGDSVMAVWNAPADCREHPLLATVAAIEAQRAVKELHKRGFTLPRISLGIGINTGQVIAGDIGCADCLEYSVIGDAVNIASRLTEVVPAGKVWVTLNTFEKVEDYFSARSLSPLAVKGKRHLIKAYEILDITHELIDSQ